MSNRARHHAWPMRCGIVLLAVVLGAAAIACGDGGAPAVDGVTLSPSASPSSGDRHKGGGDETASPSATFTPSPTTTGGGTDDGDAGTPTPSPTRISDKTIRGNILVRLSQDPTLRGFEFKVVVTRGVVQLTGRVQTEKQKRTAEQIAVTEPGVKKVVSYVQVTGGGGY